MDVRGWLKENRVFIEACSSPTQQFQIIWDAAQEEICKELNVTDNYNRLRYPNGRN